MRIVFAGTPDAAVPTLRALVSAGHTVVGAITREDALVGRKRTLTPSPVARAAEELDIPLLRTKRLDAAAETWVRDRNPDLGVIVAYGGLVREPLLSSPALGWVNLHFSDLPRWRGAAPVQRALQAGEQELGLTVFRLVPELDAGAVITAATRTFAEGTTAGEALETLAHEGTATVLDAIRALEEDPGAGAPQEGEPTYAHKLSRDDGRLNLSSSSRAVLAHWAGVTPAPGAYVDHDGEPLKLRDIRPWTTTGTAADGDVDADADGDAGGDTAIGTVVLAAGRVALTVGDGKLEVVTVQPAGKAAMAAADWLRGRGGKTVLS